MEVIRDIPELRDWRESVAFDARRVGFVPTMGNLHAGHLALIDHAKRRADVVVVSIFVNPLQFEDPDDLARYPRTEARDLELLERAGVPAVFLPIEPELYPHGQHNIVRVDAGPLGQRLEGAARPGHFTGVATVVTKLFNLVRPDVAVFGEKDAQQVAVIRRLVTDLDMSVELAIEPTHREPDGLAISSRNRFLDAEQRRQAPAVHRALKRAAESLAGGHTVAATLAGARHWLTQQGFAVDYLVYCDDERFEEQARLVTHGRLLVAARLGRVRLIDNLALHSPYPASVGSDR
ncbi:pantoate--beta-alanine ligase [Guyparkeria sp.]|uniref:pantoate--beta-alanine ligase n=1 Tax=Guyparkeria sp. TaxID=2035736 RepID=UPI0039710BED